MSLKTKWSVFHIKPFPEKISMGWDACRLEYNFDNACKSGVAIPRLTEAWPFNKNADFDIKVLHGTSKLCTDSNRMIYIYNKP